MNSIETIRGANDGKGKPVKTFPEQYEINLRKVISKNVVLDQYKGYIIQDLDKLILDVMEFHDKK